jgi:hypothetical protein
MINWTNPRSCPMRRRRGDMPHRDGFHRPQL